MAYRQTTLFCNHRTTSVRIISQVETDCLPWDLSLNIIDEATKQSSWSYQSRLFSHLLFIFLLIQFVFLLLGWPFPLILCILQIVCFSTLFNSTHMCNWWMKSTQDCHVHNLHILIKCFTSFLESERPPKLEQLLWPTYYN